MSGVAAILVTWRGGDYQETIPLEERGGGIGLTNPAPPAGPKRLTSIGFWEILGFYYPGKGLLGVLGDIVSVLETLFDQNRGNLDLVKNSMP